MKYTMASVPISTILNGEDLPCTAFDHNATCPTRNLNQCVALMQTNFTLWDKAMHAPNMSLFSDLLNGVLRGGSLGLHSVRMSVLAHLSQVCSRRRRTLCSI